LAYTKQSNVSYTEYKTQTQQPEFKKQELDHVVAIDLGLASLLLTTSDDQLMKKT
jgi:transposase